MSDGIWAAASGAINQLAVLDTSANNVANASTPGYKTEQIVFSEVMAGASQRRDVRLSQIAQTSSDVSAAGSMSTGRGLDVALTGEGFFKVKVGDEEQYTRAGSFDVSKEGHLVDKSGADVLDRSGAAILVPREAKAVEISADGTVSADGNKVGQLGVVTFDKASMLERAEGQRYRATANTGAAKEIDPALSPGALEQSNASPVRSMVDIVSAVRGFEVCEKAVEAFRDADMRAAQSIMKS
jgi:flagellar basal-body rod protein FlgF